MTESGVDGNFRRLEEEVNRLLEVLEQLRGENTSLRERIATLESSQQDLEAVRERLASAEEERRLTTERNQQAKDRLASILDRLEQAEL